MPSTRSHDHRRPGRYAFEKKEFQRLIVELKRVSVEKRLLASADRFRDWSFAYDRQPLADGAFLDGAAREYRAAKKVFVCSISRLTVRGT
jgi:hypothetical protein